MTMFDENGNRIVPESKDEILDDEKIEVEKEEMD
jgi:hypothetical protein